jgi:hypothetical protein
MKSLIITENEKKIILEGYNLNQGKVKQLNEELNKISSMMGLDKKFNLINEESILTKGLFSLPMFKGFQKYLDNVGTEAAENLMKKDISELSSVLEREGVTNQNLSKKAKDFWSKESIKGETGLKGQEETELIDWFLKTKYADELANINNQILEELETHQNSVLKNITDGIDDMKLPDGGTPDFVTDLDKLTYATTTEINENITKLTKAEEFCESKLKKLRDEITVARTERNSALLKRLQEQETKWLDLKKELSNKKMLFNDWKTNADTIYNKIPKKTLKITDENGITKEYDMTNLSATQKFLLTNGVTKQFQIINTLVKMYDIWKTGNVLSSIAESVAGLRNALGQPPNSFDLTSVEAYTQNIVSTLKAVTGRPKPGTTLKFWEKFSPDIANKMRTSFDDEWRSFINTLDASDLTDVEKDQIKKTILDKFANSQKRGEQAFIFTDDVKTILERCGTDENGKKIQSAYDKAMAEYSTPLFKKYAWVKEFLNEYLFGKTWKDFAGNLLTAFVRLGFSGLVTGMRKALYPLIKYGLNAKGLIRTYLRIWMIKASFHGVILTLSLVIKNLAFLFCETFGLCDITTKMYEDWSEGVWSEYFNGIGEAVKSFPTLSFKFGWEDDPYMGTNIMGRPRLKRNFTTGEIFFRQYAIEILMEMNFQMKKTKSEEDQNKLNQQAAADYQNETKTKWVENSIENAGPENVKLFLTTQSKLPVYQNSIKDPTIKEHMYYKFTFTTEMPEEYKGGAINKDAVSKFENFSTSLDKVAGQVRVCSTTPKQLPDGTQDCKGKSWRVDVFSPYAASSLNRDDNFEKYYKLAKDGGSGPLYQKAKAMYDQELIYFTNEEEGNKPFPSIGTDMVNVEPINNIVKNLR